MKQLLSLLLICGLSTVAFAKNKVLYTELVPSADTEKPPQYDLFVIPDQKKPQTKKNIERGVFSYASNADCIVYLHDSAESNLYIITDFVSMSKILVASHVANFNLKNGSLYYVQTEKAGEKIFKNLFVISDFKSLAKTELARHINDFQADLD
jgi:hypothetical protein